ncbi:PREDICTED: putative quinone-oxidoreductase homolog, chloroplastic [Fragaria vesca subsp. vesca]|uniref:putative quinone-oxidoreductase homolog, chloroplastic n=1 Tax=Fragaria vesca subsp. vesca TaxID=101020 RepID=UPI0002C32FA9|nr:PREDICTED: putative quinone-oxidoreductase homolog, chloroplastic [Fragaria vesca subsp. vesca]
MAAELMHAVLYDSYGGGPSSLKHVQVPIPTPKKNEVLLKLEAASLNPGDCKIQKGQARPIFPRKLPHIPVTDVAGEVVELGEDVKNFKVGDKVVAMPSYGYGGGLGEFAAANAEMVVARPSEVSAADGAGLPVAALSAHWALTKDAEIKLDGTDEPKNILITGASGNVGLYAVQLAKLGNAHVTATCGARNIELVKSSLFTFVLKKLTFSKKTLVPLIISLKGENLDFLVKLVKEGKLKTVIDSTFPLSKAEEAWAKRLDGKNTGKIIVEQKVHDLNFS